MSKRERSPNDFYRTPPEITRAFLARLRIVPPATILEPAAGDGAMLDELARRWPEAKIDAWDVAPQHPRVDRCEFWGGIGADRYDLVMTNPPYVTAFQFAQIGLSRLAPGGTLVLLLRLGFMASQTRARWLRDHMPHHVYVLSARPSFDGVGTDASDYGWFVWKNSGKSYSPRWSVM